MWFCCIEDEESESDKNLIETVFNSSIPEQDTSDDSEPDLSMPLDVHQKIRCNKGKG